MGELDEFIEAIEAGGFDGHLDRIASACVDRVRSGAVEMAWRLRFDGDEWDAETVTVGELKFAEAHCTVSGVDERGRPWRRRATFHELDPRGNAEHLVALLTAHLHKTRGLPVTEAVDRAEALTARDLADVVSEYEIVRPPKDDAGTPTTS